MKKFCLAIVLTCLAVASIATAQQKDRKPRSFIADILDVERLTNHSDLIVIGRVSSVDDRTERGIATISVGQVVKGEAPSATLTVEFDPERPTSYEIIAPPTAGLFFLARNANGGYRFAETTYPVLIARADAVVPDQSPLDRVVNIIGQVLFGPDPVEFRRIAEHQLHYTRTEQATQLFRRAVYDEDMEIKLQGICALVDRDDKEALVIAEQILKNPPTVPAQNLLDNVAAAVEYAKERARGKP